MKKERRCVPKFGTKSMNEKDNLIFAYEKYYMSELCKSRVQLYAQAETIADHKHFFRIIKNRMEEDERLRIVLANRNEMIEELCRYLGDYHRAEVDAVYQSVIDEWMDKLVKK